MWEQNQPIALLSIHAPTRGATEWEACVAESLSLSIHAPTRGATIYVSQALYDVHTFNPRSYKRSDKLFPQLA